MVLTHWRAGRVLVPRDSGDREGGIGDLQAGGYRRGRIGPDTDAVYSAASDGRAREQSGGAHVSPLHATFRQRKCERGVLTILESGVLRRLKGWLIQEALRYLKKIGF